MQYEPVSCPNVPTTSRFVVREVCLSTERVTCCRQVLPSNMVYVHSNDSPGSQTTRIQFPGILPGDSLGLVQRGEHGEAKLRAVKGCSPLIAWPTRQAPLVFFGQVQRT
jgi:hypothetical protein